MTDGSDPGQYLQFREAVQALDTGTSSVCNNCSTNTHGWSATSVTRVNRTKKMLIARNAPLEVKNMYGGTVLGQALWSAYNEPKLDYLLIIETLIAAGAQIDPEWNKWIDQLKH